MILNDKEKKIPIIFIFFIPIYFLFECFSGYLFEKNGLISYMFGTFWVFYFLFMYFRIGVSRHNISIIFFLIYIFLKILFSSNFLVSLNQYATLFISMSVFIVSFKYLNTQNAFLVISKISMSFLVIYFLNLIVSNLFLQSSFSGYIKDTQNVWNTGNIFTNGLNSIVFLSLATPLIIPFIKSKKNKVLYLILLFIGIVSVLISFKRISILAIPVGFIVILLTNKNILSNFRNIILVSLTILLTFPIYSDIIEKQFEARQKTFNRGFQREGRYLETVLVWSNALSFSSINESIFGKEMFNSVNNYGLVVDKKRMIHVDYNQLLHGSGFIGLFMYLYIHINLIRKMILYSKRGNHYLNDYNNTSIYDKKLINYSPSVFYAFIVISLFLSIGGGFHLVLFNSVKFLFLGSILGFWYNLYIKKSNFLNKK